MSNSSASLAFRNHRESYMTLIKTRQNGLKKALVDLVSSAKYKCLLIDSPDPSMCAMRIDQLLQQFKDQKEVIYSCKYLNYYLGPENQTFVSLEALSGIFIKSYIFKKFTNLLVVTISQSIDLFDKNDKDFVCIKNIISCIKVSLIRKIIFINLKSKSFDLCLSLFPIGTVIKLDDSIGISFESNMEKIIYKNQALLEAVCDGRALSVVDLINTSTDINASLNEDGYTILHMAAKKGYKEIIMILLGRGANISVKNYAENSPLHLAVENGHLDCVLTLLENNADVDAVNKAKKTALHVAAEEGFKDILILLINYGATVNIRSSLGFTPLHCASMKGHVNVAKILIENDGKVDVKSSSGYTPLHLAITGGYKDMVEVLLKHNANINEKTNTNQTCVHIAISSRHLDITVLLLKSCQSSSLRTIYKDSVLLELAKKTGDEYMIKLFV